ncbi:MAG TPA: ACP phosphodiesterase [Burkholderiales bacterium]|nr:ACP phosphodiesterase [Burkholderiales bacterium]
MNYLAHLYLSEPHEDAWLGSLMGDFVKGPLDDRYGREITRGIAMHRKIDVFTDAHPVVLRSKSRMSAGRRRYAGIMVDVFYDHFLARHWQDFHDEPLAEFTGRVYRVLQRYHTVLPERLQRMAPMMMQWDWLGSYADIGSIYTALNRMGQRLKRENRLLNSADELVGNYAQLEADFREFLPDVLRFVRNYEARPGFVQPDQRR